MDLVTLALSKKYVDDTLKGEGALKGEKGDPGKTPQKGTDYWTEQDKAEIKSYVDEAILNGEW